MDGAGNLYGVTLWGGNTVLCDGNPNPIPGCGVFFRLNLSAGNLTVSVSGNGTVTSAPAGINCPTTCSASFAPGTQVTLTATAASGSTFTGWGSPLANILPPICSGTAPCTVTVTMNSDQIVTAAFTQNVSQTLSVSLIGNRGGTVTSSPLGIDCGSTCSANFRAGTRVTLTATPAAAWGFAGWGGACSGIGACSVPLDANASVSAGFSTLFKAPQVLQPDAAALPPAAMSALPLPPPKF
jgi:List-Bact-rpt repeat protein